MSNPWRILLPLCAVCVKRKTTLHCATCGGAVCTDCIVGSFRDQRMCKYCSEYLGRKGTKVVEPPSDAIEAIPPTTTSRVVD